MLESVIAIKNGPARSVVTSVAKRAGRSCMMDEAKFEKIYQAYARPLWSYICRISGSATLADDLVQEAFLRLLRRAPLLETDEQKMKSYLYRIATNLVHDHFRNAKRENRWQAESTIHSTEEIAFVQTAEETDMARVFGELKTQERALLWLAYVEGHEHREIADMLGLNVMSVRVLLFRARRKLARLLESRGLKREV